MRDIKEKINHSEIRIGALSYDINLDEEINDGLLIDNNMTRIYIDKDVKGRAILDLLAVAVDEIISLESGGYKPAGFARSLVKLFSFNDLNFIAEEYLDIEYLDDSYIYIDGEPYQISLSDLSNRDFIIREVSREIEIASASSSERAKMSLVTAIVLAFDNTSEVDNSADFLLVYSAGLTSFLINNNVDIFRN